MANLSQEKVLDLYEQIIDILKNARKSGSYDGIDEKITTLLNFHGITSFEELNRMMSDKGDEMLVELDENGTPTGEVFPRKQIHKEHRWHREVGCLPVRSFIDHAGNKRLMVLLEKRSPAKAQHRGCWALVAGHVVGNASILEAACAEAGEELRSLYYKEDFLQITKPTKNVREGENYCYATAFVVSDRLVKDQFLYQPEEVSGLAWYSIEEFEDMVKRENPKEAIFRNNEYYQSIISALKKLEHFPLWDAFLATHAFGPLQDVIGLAAEQEEKKPSAEQSDLTKPKTSEKKKAD